MHCNCLKPIGTGSAHTRVYSRRKSGSVGATSLCEHIRRRKSRVIHISTGASRCHAGVGNIEKLFETSRNGIRPKKLKSRTGRNMMITHLTDFSGLIGRGERIRTRFRPAYENSHFLRFRCKARESMDLPAVYVAERDCSAGHVCDPRWFLIQSRTVRDWPTNPCSRNSRQS